MDMNSDTMVSVIKRLRRAQGQIGGVIKMIQEQPLQLLALGRARAGFKIISTGLQQCALDDEGTGAAEREQLERLFLALA